jgi:hypothetical protein
MKISERTIAFLDGMITGDAAIHNAHCVPIQ